MSGKPRLLDLFCGRGGWTKGFMAEGWECVGVDLNPQPHYPGEFIQADVLMMYFEQRCGFVVAGYPANQALGHFDFTCASSSCEQFSVHCMKHFHPNPPYPELGIKLFEHTRKICEESGLPYVMENVRCAEKFVGRSVNHCGPFYLWGNAVPAAMPRELYQVSKGTKFGLDPDYFGGTGHQWRTMGPEIRKYRRENRKKFDMYYKTGSKSKARVEYKAMVAEIPLELSRYVAQCASRLVAAH